MNWIRISGTLLLSMCLALLADPTVDKALATRRAQSPANPQRVSVHVLGLFHPNELIVSAEANHPLTALAGEREIKIGNSLCERATISRRGSQVVLRCGESRLAATRLRFSANGSDAPFVISVPGKLRRGYRGRLEITANKSELIAVVEMDLETAVASIVGAELPQSTPIEALKAQAVVTRSFLAAGGRRHAEAEFCDTTHCQFLRNPPPPGSSAATATAETNGLVLTWQGMAFPTMYSASCGGTTRTLVQAGYRVQTYPYFSMECSYCRRHPMTTGNPGHGIGLCQRGAAGMASEGADFRAILAHYFPNTEVSLLPVLIGRLG